MPIHANPLISVVVPCFNQGKYLFDCLESLNKSTFDNFEVIIIDDGSTDKETIDILKKLDMLFPKLHIRVIHQTNKGLSGARNKGINESRGNYIQFLDADDAISAQKFDTQLEYFKIKPDYSAIVSNYWLANTNINNTYAPDDTIVSFELNTKSFIKNWEKGLTIPIHCGLFKRESFEKIAFCETFQAKEDWIFWTDLSYCHKIFYHKHRQAIYRIHNSNMTKNYRKMLLNWVKAQTFLIQKYSYLFTKEELQEELDSNINHLDKAYLSPLINNKQTVRALIIAVLRKNATLYRLAYRVRSLLMKAL